MIDFFTNSVVANSITLRKYKVEDVAFRIAGTGSLGVQRYIFLLHNPDNKSDFLLVDMKESRPSAVEKYISIQQPAWTSNAERELVIQSRMQYATVALSDKTAYKNVYFVIQELQPAEDKIDMTLLNGHDKQARW